jgi:hypothetical protein
MNRFLLTIGFVALLPATAAAQANPVVGNDASGDASASDHPAPYAKLAADLGTPTLLSSAGPADKSLLRLRFVGAGESASNWVKMTSISIAKVKPADTLVAARTIIKKFKARLAAQKHAKTTEFIEGQNLASNAYFTFVTSDGIADQGIAYSPAEGFVSVIEVAYRHGFVHRASDRALLRTVMNGR